MRLSLFLALAVLTLSACSGLGPAGPDPDPEVPTDGPAEPTYPAYETFDPAEYDAGPPASTEVVHDVPPGVMAGRVVIPGQAGPPAPQEPQPQQVEGFRIQIFSSANRQSAENVRTEAVQWWEGAQSSAGAPDQMEVLVAYLQPYYRVRMGAFASRDAADSALALVRRQYPEAFIVPDLVTVMR